MARTLRFDEIFNKLPAGMPPLETLEKRVLLNPATVRTFLSTMDRWKIEDDDVRHLLGGMSRRVYSSFKKGGAQMLGGDTIYRIFCLLFLSRALIILDGGYEVDKWMQEPIRDEFFAGKTPLNYLAEGGSKAFTAMRENFEERLKTVEPPKKQSLKKKPTREAIQWNIQGGPRRTIDARRGNRLLNQ